jgi:capsid protein
MSLAASIASPLVWIASRVMAWHEAALRTSERGYIPGITKDSRLDLTEMDLWEIRRKGHFFEANTHIVPAMGSVFEQYVVGPGGLAGTPASSSQEFNDIARQEWDTWQPFADLCSLRGFKQMVSLAGYSWFTVGESFLVKRYGDSGFPRLQMVEGHRVGSGGRFGSSGSDAFFNGVELDRNGRPVAYHMALGLDGAEFTRVPASDVIHVFEPTRPGQLRGLPMYSNVMNKLQDMIELERFEMKAAKALSAIAAVWKTRDKQIQGDGARAVRMNPQLRTNANASTTTENRERQVRSVVGGEMIALYNDETIESPVSNRPSVVTLEYFQKLQRDICAGSGVPPNLVFPQSMQGTVTRADMDRAANYFRMRSAVLQDVVRDVYRWVIGHAIRYSPLFRNVSIPADWWKLSVRPPKQCNVDIGRNSNAILSELKAGIRTFRDTIGEAGDDWREVLEQRAVETRFIQDLSAKHTVSADLISDIAAGQPPQQPDTQAAGTPTL